MGRPPVPCGSPSSLMATWAVLPGGPATKAQQLWVASGKSSRTRWMKACAASASGACAPDVMKRLLWIVCSTRWTRAGIACREESGANAIHQVARGGSPRRHAVEELAFRGGEARRSIAVDLAQQAHDLFTVQLVQRVD